MPRHCMRIGMTSSIEARICNDVPSPFCGIASDDLKIQVDGVRLAVVANGDAVTVPGAYWWSCRLGPSAVAR